MELGLYQTQSMKLVMTQELRQAITILQYPTLELSQFLHQQAMENPLIDLQERSVEMKSEQTDVADSDHDSWFYDGENDYNPVNFIKSEDETLQMHLLEQLTWLELTDEEKAIAEYVIYCLDENGYLDCSLECLRDELHVPLEKIERILTQIQQLDPIGVGARSLSECLLLQMKAMGRDMPVVEEIITHHLDEFADKKFSFLSKTLDITMKELKEADDFIRSLNPRPCSGFEKNRAEWVEPEFFIEQNKQGELFVRMNEDLVPEVSLNERYFRILKQHQDAKSYLDNQLQKFEWLKRSLDQRRQTLQNLGEYLLQAQRAFFDHGYEALRPMTLKEVAVHIDVHESTISRAVKNKTIQTPKGTIPLKSLFTSKLDKTNQMEDTSSAQVKIQIQRMVEKESKHKPLSDQKIANSLKEDGIDISRRTVAKYREELRIPSSSKRKSIVV